MSKEIAKQENNGIQIKTVNVNELSTLNLESAAVMPVDLMSDYWTPETVGESKRVVFTKVEPVSTIDQQSGEVIELECAFFVTPVDGKLQSIRNGSKKLVSAVQNLPANTPLLITYKGKVKNKSNGFKSDDWSIQPLILQA
jgi:hypothetical protein